MRGDRPYHHGDLPAALLAAAAAEIAEVGPAAVSLRRVAARAGVSHTAAAHHFGDKRGLLTALATDGHLALADVLSAARPAGMLALGDAYLRFAHERRPWFEVMFRPDIVRTHDPDLVAACAASFGALRASTTGSQGDDAAYAAWSLVHGMAVLWLAGNLPASTIEEVHALFRRSARALTRTTAAARAGGARSA